MTDEPMERLVRSLKDDLDNVTAERDRLQAALTLVAIPMPHPLREDHEFAGCTGCAQLAQRALDGHDYRPNAAQLDGSEVMGGMTPEQAHEFYADPANQEPVGPPVRRSGGVRQPDSPITIMEDTTNRPIEG